MAERFRHEPTDVDPQVAAMERRREASERPAQYRTPTADQGTLFEASAVSSSGQAAGVEVGPTSFSVTGLVSYRRCPRQYYWMAIRPLPRRASAAARIGTAVHRWIEQRGDRQLGLLEPAVDDGTAHLVDPIDPGGDEGQAPASVVLGLRAAFLASPYAELDPTRIEAPFVLAVEGRAVRGRIDAVYRRAGQLELVDFKTGSPPDDGDRAASTQLDLYALAASDVWGEQASVLRTTYCYLHRDGSFRLIETDWDDDRLAAARADLAASLAGVAAGDYGATPGRWCARCEWREVCRPGRAFLESLAQARDQPG